MRTCVKLVLLAATASAALVSGGSTTADATPAPPHELYALAAKAQYVNNRDDRSRGEGGNPFGATQGTGAATTRAHGRGPLPGDEGLFQLTLYSSPKLDESVGSSTLICEYGFNRIGSCNVVFQLDNGTLVGRATFAALERTAFSVSITGGTGQYRNSRGNVRVANADIGKAVIGKVKVTHNVPSVLLEPEKMTFALKMPSAAEETTLYSVAKTQQYIDNSDDERRGWSNNPFGMRDLTTEALEGQGRAGPFPGDTAFFTFAVYSNTALKGKAGSATFTCLYAFDRNAFCDGTYRLRGGTLITGGLVDFDAPTFTLAVTGGTGVYARAGGDLVSSAGPNGAQRLVVTRA